MQNNFEKFQYKAAKNFTSKKMIRALIFFLLLIEGNFVFLKTNQQKLQLHAYFIVSKVKLMQPISYRQLMAPPHYSF